MAKISHISKFSLSCSIHASLSTYIIIFVGMYNVNFFVELPSEINISPDLQLIKASVVANHGLPRINEFPPRLLLGVKIINSIGYSHESKDTNTSSNTPSGLIIDLFANCNNVGVYSRLGSFNSQ